jgi:hypothetical protein
MVLPTARIEGALLPQCAQSRQSELLARYGRVPSLVSLDRGVDISRDLSMHREEFIVVGWTDPEGSRPHLGALLLAYYAPDGRLVYAGRGRHRHARARAGAPAARLKPVASDRMPLDVPPPRTSRFGSPIVLSGFGAQITSPPYDPRISLADNCQELPQPRSDEAEIGSC